ncbi:sigma 54-interacting transcriptional regulator [Mesorhizobium sp. M0006]|uniref:sigma 54-interacting transcriptional regulator n=1 Tax=Mesorhizobium sp. M0006 TaxID=2956838 RepID=UPI00333715A3
MRKDITPVKIPVAPPALTAMQRFLERMLPGSAPAMVDFRSQLISFAINPATNNLLIRGPSGSGKSTAARAVAALVRVAMLTAEEAERVLSALKLEGPNLISMLSLSDWYVELPMTGLVESLADVQLFGSVKGAYTGAIEGPGIFEKAANGRMKGSPTVAAALTGGVVFLDEIGDVPQVLQGKLLAILSGGRVHRVGGEGDPNYAVDFDGTVIAATWKSLDPSEFRPDLLARIAGTEVAVPGLDRRAGDLEEIIRTVADGVLHMIRSRIEHAERTEPGSVDKAYWRGWSEALTGLGDRDVAMLTKTDWSVYGHMRGLAAAIRQILVFREDVANVVARLPLIGDADSQSTGAAISIYDRLLRRPPDGTGIASHLRALALEDARELRLLLDDTEMRGRLARSLGLTEAKIRTQTLELGRTRRRSMGDGE